MEIKELEQIINILRQSDITEFELEKEGTHIRLSRSVRLVSSAAGAISRAAEEVQPAIIGIVDGGLSASTASEALQAQQIPDKFVRVESPLVGTFYRKPSPDSETFVSEGGVVKKGDILCIVEAMKLMNEIEAPCGGKIHKILVNDGQVVEYGEVLFIIDPSA